MSDPEITVIMPAFNERGRIERQLEALRNQQTSYSWEVVVADNGSSDGTTDVVQDIQKGMPNLRLVLATGKQGAGHARNMGAKHARGDLLLFCDADDIVTESWIENLADGLKKYDAVGGPTDTGPLNSRESRILRPPPVDDHLPEVFGFPRAVTANCGVRASVFNDLEGFDSSYLDSQDTEFFLRMQVKGHTVGFVPDAVVLYRHDKGLKATLRKVYRWQETRPRLCREYGGYRTKDQPWRGILGWGTLILTVWYLVAGKRRRIKWLGSAVHSYARLVGSIKHRTVYL